jgi:hypothetical protein
MYQHNELPGMLLSHYSNTSTPTIDPNHPLPHTTLPSAITDTLSQHIHLSSLVQIVPTFEYLIPHWTPILMNSCKSIEDTLRHWTHHITQYLHYYTLTHTLTTLGPHEIYPPAQWYTHTHLIEQSLLPFFSPTLTTFQNILTPLIQ